MHLPSYDVLWRTIWGDMQRLGPVRSYSAAGLRCERERVGLDALKTWGRGDVLSALARPAR